MRLEPIPVHPITPETAPTRSQFPLASAVSARRRSRRLLILLLFACLIVYLIGNSAMPLFDRDEGWYSQISRNMVQSGDWVVPRFRTEIFYGKPVMAFWCQALSMKILGQTSFAARLPSVIFGMATLLAVWWAVDRYVGHRRALWTIFVLATSVLFIVLSKLSLTDAELLFWVTVAQICLAAVYFRRSNIWVCILLWTMMGLATLTKGPVIVGTLAATMIALAIYDTAADFISSRRKWKSRGIDPAPSLWQAFLRSTRWWWKTQPWLAILIVPAVVAPWMILVHQRSPDFLKRTIEEFWLAPIFSKALNSRSSIPGFYLAVIWPAFMPWSLLLIMVLIKGWQHRRLGPIRFCLAATIGPLIVIELTKQKLPHYLLPMFPALAFLTADVIVRCRRGNCHAMLQRGWKSAVIGWSIIIAAMSIAPWSLIPLYPQLPRAALAAVTLVGFATAIAVIFFFFTRRLGQGFLTMGAATLVLFALVTGIVLPQLPPLNSARLAAQSMWQAGFHGDEEVAMFGYAEPSLTFYLNGKGRTFPPDYLEKNPRRLWPRWIVMSTETWNQLSPGKRSHLEQVAVFPSMNTMSSDFVQDIKKELGQMGVSQFKNPISEKNSGAIVVLHKK